MKKTILLTTIAAALLAAESKAQTPVYSTGFDDATQKAGWQLFRKGAATSGPYWVYSSSGAFSAPEQISHDYPVGGSVPTDNWFVSPMLHFPSGAMIDSIRNRFSGPGKPNPGDTVAIYLLSGSPDPALATSKVLLHDYRDTKYVNDGLWQLSKDIPIPPTAGHCYLAFRYHTISNWLVVRFDNLSISMTGTHVAQADAAPILNLFPNPVTDMLYLELPATTEATISITDLNGKVVLRERYRPAIHLNSLVPGTYLLQLKMDSGNMLSRTLIKK